MKFALNGKPVIQPNVPPWLASILSYLKQQCQEDFTLLITQTNKHSKLYYTLEHRKAKVYASLSRTGGRTEPILTLTFFQRALPDIDQHLIPPFEQTFSIAKSESVETTHLLGQLLLKRLCTQNAYSQAQNPKVKISSLPTDAAPVYGDRIIELFEVNGHCVAVLENGQQYRFPKEEAVQKTLKAHRYLVMHPTHGWETVCGLEFSHYFEAI